MVVRSLALYLALTTLPAAAQNNFTIKLHGKPAGKASYSIEKTKDGYHVKSKVSYRLSAADNAPPDADAAPTKARSSAAPGRAADFQFVEDYKLDANSSYAGGFITDMVTLVNTSYNINKSRDQLFISQNQVGASGLSTPIAIKPNFVLLPDYDPSALQSLLLETSHIPQKKISISSWFRAKIPAKMRYPPYGSPTNSIPTAPSMENPSPSTISFSGSTNPNTTSSPTRPTP